MNRADAPVRQIVFLVGGTGSRLGDITRELPKPLLPVAGRPFLDYLLRKAARHGLTRVLLLAGYRAEAMHAYLQQSDVAATLGLEIDVAVEAHPLGTAGALVAVRDRLDPAFLLANGDTWFDLDWSEVAAVGDWPVLMALREVPQADRYETVVLEGERVMNMRRRDSAAGQALINGGLYRIGRAILDGAVAPSSLETDLLPSLCAAGRVGGRVFDGAFIDIGLPDSYRSAQGLLATSAD
jgi:NDP-sugar pyrophosphorylase family protein